MLGRLVGAAGSDATQAATARYHREGFEAAAVTSGRGADELPAAGQTAAKPSCASDHPYAVVATATGTGPWADTAGLVVGRGCWPTRVIAT